MIDAMLVNVADEPATSAPVLTGLVPCALRREPCLQWCMCAATCLWHLSVCHPGIAVPAAPRLLAVCRSASDGLQIGSTTLDTLGSRAGISSDCKSLR